MITNGSSLSIQTSGRPNLQDALSDWFTNFKIGTIVKTVVDFQLQEVVTYLEYQAVYQPFTTKQLQVKPDGQRSWSWSSLHIKGSDPEFSLDDVVMILGKRCRIMQKFEWSEYGYTQYETIEDYGQAMRASLSDSVKVSEALT